VRGDGQRFIVCADEKLTAFVELESAIRGSESLATAVGWNVSAVKQVSALT
jgi:hypothetical protein